MGSRASALFFGTPAIAVPSLRALCRVCEVRGVISQPDRPAGRGWTASPTPVKAAALELGLPVYQPHKVRDGELERYVRQADVDVSVVIAYGRILPSAVLSAPRHGSVNLHASLLPGHRGAAPIQRAIMRGDTVTGVCLMQMDEGMDTGPVLARREIPIEDDDDAGTLAEKIAELAAQVTEEYVPKAARGELAPVPQDHSRATHAPPITREDTRLDFSLEPRAVRNRVRGLSPRPGAEVWADRRERPRARLRILSLALCDKRMEGAPPGTILVEGGRVFVAAGGDSALELLSAQPDGKRVQSGRDLANGRWLSTGDRLLSDS
jgi:methionyl-tRNA formyltransferase